MRQNSIEIYHATKFKHGTKKRQIVETLAFMGKATMHQIADYMRVPVHTISGRFGELEKMQVISEFSKSSDNKTIWKLCE